MCLATILPFRVSFIITWWQQCIITAVRRALLWLYFPISCFIYPRRKVQFNMSRCKSSIRWVVEYKWRETLQLIVPCHYSSFQGFMQLGHVWSMLFQFPTQTNDNIIKNSIGILVNTGALKVTHSHSKQQKKNYLSMIPLPSVLSSSSGPNFPPCRSSTSFSSACQEFLKCGQTQNQIQKQTMHHL